MSIRRIMLPIVALAGAAASTYTARDWIQSRSMVEESNTAAPAKPVTKGVLVAAKALSVGQFIQPNDVRWQQWPDVGTPDSYFVEGKRSLDDVVGAVLRRPLAEGEPLIGYNVVKPGERGFLAAVLDPDMRAVSVPVDETSSNAGLIFPGDRVDLVLTQTIRTGEGTAGQRRVGETVLRDVRVLAMGRRLKTEDGDAVGADQVRTVTLEVTPTGAEQVALVTELGKLSLSLRSLASRDPNAGAAPPVFRATWDVDVSPVLRSENQPRTTMAVIRGPEAQTVSIRKGVTP